MQGSENVFKELVRDCCIFMDDMARYHLCHNVACLANERRCKVLLQVHQPVFKM